MNVNIEEIKNIICSYNNDANLNIIDQAFDYASVIFGVKKNNYKEHFIKHHLNVAYILANMYLDVESIVAGLLHESIEYNFCTYDDISKKFGEEIASLVKGVTKIFNVSSKDIKSRQDESIRRMILAMVDDLRVIFILLADRLQQMRSLSSLSANSQIIVAQETKDIYAPIAGRLGIFSIKKELEDYSFMYLMSEKYKEIANLVKKDKQESERFVKSVKKIIVHKMKEANLECEVLGRYKHIYSIYYKMKSQKLPFDEIYDIIAFRIILNSISDCYAALGKIHSMWQPIPKKIKDYIAVPKPNMYQSIHTTVNGLSGERIEIQIRTKQMDTIAKSGVAAHWSYKEGKNIDEKTSKTFAWLQNLIESHENYKEPNEFIENVKINLFSNEVYIFTPTGEVKTFPQGSSPIDFAYAIHSDIGDQCVGARVNGRMQPLKYRLKTGDKVEIITSKNQHPSKDWLNIVKTSKARSKIRQWIKIEEKERSLSLGSEMCEKVFRKNKLNFKKLLKQEEFKTVLETFNYQNNDDLIAAVGYGKITPVQLLRHFSPNPNKDHSENKITQIFKKSSKSGVQVQGIDDVLLRFGKCCKPLPGDEIVGYITRGYGVTVHKKNCINVLKISPDRHIEVYWDSGDQFEYPVEIVIYAMDRLGLLADISSAISKNKANILNVKTNVDIDGLAEESFIIMVKDINHLNKIIKSINKIKNVKGVKRKNN